MKNDDMLSQEEIDALLRGTDINEVEDEQGADSTTNVDDYLDSFEQDTLGEIGNISFGSSATALSSLLNQKVEITTPTVSIINRRNLQAEFPEPYVAIQVQYTAGFTGTNLLVIQQNDAAVIADLMLGGDGEQPNPDLNDIQLSAVQEAMNQMMGSAATSMSTIFNKKIDISPPSIALLDLTQGEGENAIPEEELLVKVSFRLAVGSLIDSNIMQLLPLPFARSMVEELINPGVKQEKSSTGLVSDSTPASEQPAAQQAALDKKVQPASSASHESPQFNVQPASFASFGEVPAQQQENRNLDMLLDIPLQVTVELGKTKSSVKDILEWSTGSIIELDKLAGEPVDILVNNRLVAKGEVVVIEENFGVRIIDILSHSDRLKNLN
ncbi:MAG TPA: flagellar motor switch phosphatase FliY [Chondromyces sp.]|nr:flagellar motor switch phosphatase FliY [Chondromyces sp.]